VFAEVRAITQSGSQRQYRGVWGEKVVPADSTQRRRLFHSIHLRASMNSQVKSDSCESLGSNDATVKKLHN
jgi:hypothetical protein